MVLMDTFEENYINTDNPISNFEDIQDSFKNEWMKYASD
jgi:hypothetical protein